MPTNAVYGFVTMVMKFLRAEAPTHVAMVFDAPGATFRDELFPDYKANRSAMPDELVSQLPLVRRAVEALQLLTLYRCSCRCHGKGLSLRKGPGGAKIAVPCTP